MCMKNMEERELALGAPSRRGLLEKGLQAPPPPTPKENFWEPCIYGIHLHMTGPLVQQIAPSTTHNAPVAS